MNNEQTHITLGDLISNIWDVRGFISIGMIIALILTVIWLVIGDRKFEAHMMVSPTPSINQITEGASFPTSAVAQFNPLEGTVTLSSKSTGLFKALIVSPRVAWLLMKTDMIEKGVRNDPLAGLFARDTAGWNARDAANYLSETVKISPKADVQGLLEISYRHPDADFAEAFLSKLHAITDELIRNDYRRLTEDRVFYLKKAILQTENPEHRMGLTNLLLDLEKELIMVNADRAFSVQMIDPPTASRETRYPAIWVILISFIAIGAFLGGLYRPCSEVTEYKKCLLYLIYLFLLLRRGNVHFSKKLFNPWMPLRIFMCRIPQQAEMKLVLS